MNDEAAKNPELTSAESHVARPARRAQEKKGHVEMTVPEPTDPEVYTQSDPEDLVGPEEGDPGTFAGDYVSAEDDEDDEYGEEVVVESGDLDDRRHPEVIVENDLVLDDEDIEGDVVEQEYVPGTYTGEYRKAN